MTSPIELTTRPALAPTALESLVADVASGDREAFTELYERMSPRVFGLVLRMLSSRARAEEVVQEVFLEVWQKAGAFDASRGSALTWVLTIAHHRSVDHVRLHRNATLRDEGSGLRHLEAPRDIVSDQVGDRAGARVVREALAGLPQVQRTVLYLAYFEGLTQTQIAERTATPLGTVKTRTRDALLQLRRRMSAADPL